MNHNSFRLHQLNQLIKQLLKVLNHIKINHDFVKTFLKSFYNSNNKI